VILFSQRVFSWHPWHSSRIEFLARRSSPSATLCVHTAIMHHRVWPEELVIPFRSRYSRWRYRFRYSLMIRIVCSVHISSRVPTGPEKSWKTMKEKSGPERSWNWALVLKKCWYLITVVLSGAEKSVQHASCPMKQILLLNFPFHVLMCVCFIPVCCHWCSFRLVQLLLLWTKKYCISIALLVLQCPVLPSNS